MKYYLAIDIGASSGRAIVGHYHDNKEIILEEIYRFKNRPLEKDDDLIWNIDYLFQEVKNGIKEALKKYPTIISVSIDTWGCDYVLLDKDDKEIYPVYCYRSQRTKKSIKEVHKLISFDELYNINGCQFQEFNTIYQLYADKLNHRLDQASSFLMIPEYLMFKLTGRKIKELTNASTTGLIDKNKQYSAQIRDTLFKNYPIFDELQLPGTEVGHFKEEIIKEVGGDIKVILCSTHDTGSAVEALDIDNNDIYISSGTWSLLGVKSDKFIVSDVSKKANYSNELGPNYVRFQKNIMGLWIIQRLAEEFNLDFVTMMNMAKESNYQEIYDVNDNNFLSSFKMSEAIRKYFIERDIASPKSQNDFINATYHSLAYSYKVAIEELENITNKIYRRIIIIGGGAKNEYLNELTGRYTNKEVVPLPIEATSLGNIKSQMEVDNR